MKWNQNLVSEGEKNHTRVVYLRISSQMFEITPTLSLSTCWYARYDSKIQHLNWRCTESKSNSSLSLLKVGAIITCRTQPLFPEPGVCGYDWIFTFPPAGTKENEIGGRWTLEICSGEWRLGCMDRGRVASELSPHTHEDKRFPASSEAKTSVSLVQPSQHVLG